MRVKRVLYTEKRCDFRSVLAYVQVHKRIRKCEEK